MAHQSTSSSSFKSTCQVNLPTRTDERTNGLTKRSKTRIDISLTDTRAHVQNRVDVDVWATEQMSVSTTNATTKETSA